MRRMTFGSAVVLTLGLASAAQAAPLNYAYTSTSADGGPGAGITYALQIDNNVASFLISGAPSSSTDWYIGEFDFKFNSGNKKPTLTSITVPTAWSIADATNPDAQILGGGGNLTNMLSGSAAGFYVTSLSGNSPMPSEGICATCAPLSATFIFTIQLPDNATYSSSIPIQVRFYDSTNGSSAFVTNQLSRQLTVPDGGTTLALLGCALIGVEALRRRSRR